MSDFAIGKNVSRSMRNACDARGATSAKSARNWLVSCPRKGTSARNLYSVVSAINGRVDAASQSVEVEGTVRGAFPELLAGMSGNAVFAVPPR